MESIPKKSGIYQIRNLVNGKVYVGSAVNLHIRRKTHLYDLRHQKHPNQKLQRAYNKYGEKSFIFEIIEIIEDKSKLVEREQFYIDNLNVIKEGYNICPIAGSQLGAKRSEESKKRMSEAQRRNSHLASIRTKEYCKTHRIGIPLSDKHKNAISKGLTGRNGWGRKVICIETGIEYKSIALAHRETGFGKSGIRECCDGKKETNCGFHWKYVD